MNCQEPDAVQQGDLQCPAPGEEEPQTLVHAGGHLAGEQVGRNGPGGPGGHQVEQKAAMCPCHKEG